LLGFDGNEAEKKKEGIPFGLLKSGKDFHWAVFLFLGCLLMFM